MFYTTQQLVLLKKKIKKKKNGKKANLPRVEIILVLDYMYHPISLFLSVAFLVECSAVLIAVSYPL
jgi:hypothetical protein